MVPTETARTLTVRMRNGDDRPFFATSVTNLPIVLLLLNLLDTDFFPYMTVTAQGDCIIQLPNKPEFGAPIGALCAMPDLDNAKNKDIPRALLCANEVQVLGLSQMTLMDLRTAGIRYIFELLELSEEELKHLHLRAETMRDIKRRLATVADGKLGLNSPLHPVMREIAVLSIKQNRINRERNLQETLRRSFWDQTP